MKTRIISAAVIIPVALLILLVLPPYVMTVALAVVCAIGAYELIAAVNKSFSAKKPGAEKAKKADKKPGAGKSDAHSKKPGAEKSATAPSPSPRVAVYAIIAAVMVPFVMYLNYAFGVPEYFGLVLVLFILISLLMIDFFLTFRSEKRMRLRQLLVVPVAALVVPYMLSTLLGLRVQGLQIGSAAAEGQTLGRALVLLPVVVTVLADSGAYFTGVTIGKHKPLPKISPNKTVEGFIGGIVAGTLGMLIYGAIISGATDLAVNIPLLLVYGILGAIVTEVGDLAFSLIKRKCGIKDYGNLIPGHGGILDRFDSLTFSAPAMLLLVTLLPAIEAIQ